MASLEQRGKHFRIIFRLGGRKHSVGAKVHDRREAEACLSRLEENLRLVERGRLSIPDGADPGLFLLSDGKLEKPVEVVRGVRLAELFRTYQSQFTAGANEAITRKMEDVHMKHLSRLIGRETPLAAITAGTVQQFVDARSRELHKGQARELWDGPFLNPNEIAEVLAHVKLHTSSAYLYPLLVTAAHTGARRSEMFRARVEDIDLDSKQVLLREKKRSRDRETFRTVDMTPYVEAVKRSQLGAHYTSREDIETLVEPVIMVPLRREWDAVKAKAEKLWEKIKDKSKGTGAANPLGRRKEAIRESKELKALRKCLNDFLYRLAHVTVLDPACGSGNFLYVALQSLLNLEKEVIAYSNAHGVPVLIPGVRPTLLHGIELNPYAQELAQVVIWIGYLQWMKFNGFVVPSDPVLDAMTNIENRDAILDLSDPENPEEPEWPEAEFIVGNPPFLGDKKMRGELGDKYVDILRKLYS